MASGKEFRAQYRKALAAKARQQRIDRQKWQRADPRPRPGMARKAAPEGGSVSGDAP